MKKRLCIYPLIVLFFFTTGCAAILVGAAAGGAGFIWFEGKLEETVRATVPHTHKAIKAGLNDLKIHILEDKGDELTAEVNGVLADGTKVWIDAESTGKSVTRLTIRVGYLGDRTMSLRIRDSIKKHL